MKKRPGEDDFEALARHSAWRISALSAGRRLNRSDYTNTAGVFDFATLAISLGLAEETLRWHFPSFEQRAIDGEIAGGAGAEFALRVAWNLAQP
jgi:hypothetical protein